MSSQNPDNKSVSTTESDVKHVEVQPGVHEITIGETEENAISKVQTAIDEKAADSAKRISVTGDLPETQAASQRYAARLLEAKAAALTALRSTTEGELEDALEVLKDRVPRPGEKFTDKTADVAKTLRGEPPIDTSAPSIELGGAELLHLPAALEGALLEMGELSPDQMQEISDINDSLKVQMEKIKPGSYDKALSSDTSRLARLLKAGLSAWEARDGGRLADWTEKTKEYAKKVGGDLLFENKSTVMPLTVVFHGLSQQSPMMEGEGLGLLTLALQDQSFAGKVAEAALAKGDRFGKVLDRMAAEGGAKATVDSLHRLFDGDGRGFDEQENFFKVKDNILPTLLSDAKFVGLLSQPDIMKKIYDMSAQTSPETVGALLSVMGRQIAEDPSLLERALHPLVFHELAVTIEGSMDNEFDAEGKKMSVAQRIRNLVDTGKELAEVVRQRLPQGVPTVQKFPRAQG